MAENDKNNKHKRDIELRSEKVRNIVGKVPPLLLRMGIAIISIIIISLLVTTYLLPYREYKNIEIELFCRPGYQDIVMPEYGNIFMTISTMQVKQGNQVCYIRTAQDSIIRFYAHLDGKILFNAGYGDFIKQGAHMYTIIPDSIASVYGIAYISEENIARINSGQPVSFTPKQISPYINGQLTGYISKIYTIPSIKNDQDKALYKVEIEFPGYKSPLHDSSFPTFTSNITGNGQILISDKPALKRILSLN